MAQDDTVDPQREHDSSTTLADETSLAVRPAGETVERGTAIGRYLVIDEVGRGGMGVVFRAYDPKLHREVALKRLHRNALDSDAEARLLREAQAMAQLSHANVITIHDVERTDDGVVMAMELVEGQTLAEWLATGLHPVAQVLDRFVQAGQGLWAAHRAGLVHRDFKPSNAIVDREGRVKVMDFGLARAEVEMEPDHARVTGPDSGVESGGRAAARISADLTPRPEGRGEIEVSGSLSDQLTRAGAVMGTPAYMSPEQHRGEVADARSDQYAFCISLWEGLFGERPVRGSLQALVYAKHQPPPPAPKGSRVPRPIVEALRRGLEPQPEDRWPSMAELLAALARDTSRGRRRRYDVAGLALIGSALAVAIWMAAADDTAPPCTDGAAQLQGVWDEARRTEVETALRGTELSYAANTWTRVSEELDRYAQGWTAQYTEACEATAVRHTQSAALLDLRMQCLRRRKLQLQATVDVLAKADTTVLERAIAQVRGLPRLERCADTEALMAAVPPPEDPQVAAEVEELRDGLARAQAEGAAGHYDEAQEQIDGLVERAEELGYEPVQAELLQKRASLANFQGDFDRSVADGTRAYELALRSGALGTAADAAADLTFVTGTRQSKIDVGRTWATSALALARRVDPAGKGVGMVINAMGVIDYRAGDFASATARFEEALPILIAAVGETDDTVATNLSNLGAMLDEQGRYTEAEPHFRRALQIHIDVFGEDHPRIGGSLDNLALCLQAQGRNEEAKALHLRALGVREPALGERNPDTALTYNNLGWDYMGLHEPDTAAEYFAKALSVFEEAYGAEHPRVAMAAESLALAELERGRFAESEALHRRALAIRRAALGEDHPNVALSLSGLGHLALRQKRYEEAVELLGQAVAIIDAKPEGAERYLADMLTGLGGALVGAKRAAEARPLLERALKLREGGGVDPVVMVETQLTLAQALADSGDDAAARAIAETARASLVGVEGKRADESRTKVDAWFSAHPVTAPPDAPPPGAPPSAAPDAPAP